MTRRHLLLVVVLLGLAPAVLAACGDSAPSGDASGSADSTTSTPDGFGPACDDAVASIVTATERYVASYASARVVSASGATQPDASSTVPAPDAEILDEAAFQAVLDGARTEIDGQGCDPARVRVDLATGLAQVDAEGPVADAVLRQLTANMMGRMPTQPTDTTVGRTDDLREVVAISPTGSTIELGPGEYQLDDSLVLLSGVSIVGAGADRTTIVSTAPEAAVLALTDRPVELRDLTVRRSGDAPGSVVLAGPAASVVVDHVRITGAVADADGQGGAGILMYALDQEAAGRGTTLEVTAAELTGNEAAGIVLAGGHRASIVDSTFSTNGQCGICFLGTSDGSVEDSAFDGNGVGVAVTGAATPTLLRIAIEGGDVGVQAGDTAAPVIRGATISGSASAAVIYTGTASGTLDDVTCADVAYGIVVGPDVYPDIGDTDCPLARTDQ